MEQETEREKKRIIQFKEQRTKNVRMFLEKPQK